MSNLVGGPWPASLELVALNLPDGLRARPALEIDRASYVELSHATLGRYACDLHSATHSATRFDVGIESNEGQVGLVFGSAHDDVGYNT